MMDDRAFVSYLEDHLAGSEAGRSTVRRIRRDHVADEVGLAMARFDLQFEEEQRSLRTAIQRLDDRPSPSLVTQAIGLTSSLLVWARRTALPEPVPSLLEDLEALAVGVWGKRLLWGAIARKAAEDPRLSDIEIERLVEMAEAQEIELLRLRDAELDTLAA